MAPPRIILVLLVLAVPCRAAWAQQETLVTPPFFASHTVIELTLAANLDALLEDVGEERDEHPAVLSFEGPEGTIHSQPLKVQTRGRYRRNPDNCPFPPLRVNFDKGKVDGTVFDGLNKIKLVTHCRTDDPEYDQYVLQEYALYRVFNLLTPRSFRVRLVRMTYLDATGRRDPLTRIAFLIEDDEHVAQRHDADVYEDEGVPPDLLDDEQRTLLYLFEYMIGNIDWNVSMQQNLALIAPDEEGPYIPLPYDFDLADVIGAPGADRHPPLGPTSLRHALFADYCGTEADLKPLLDRFNSRRDEIYALYDDVPGLAPENAEATRRYFDRFYGIVNDSRAVEREFLRPCRVKP